MIRACRERGARTTHTDDRCVPLEHSSGFDGILRFGVRVDVPVPSPSGLVLTWDATQPTNGTPSCPPRRQERDRS